MELLLDKEGGEMPTYNRNIEKNGLEISFESVPAEEIRSALKENGFRWHRINGLWYAKETPERLMLVKRICAGNSRSVGSSKKQSENLYMARPVARKIVMKRRCCYSCTMRNFFKETSERWLGIMKSAFSDEYILSLGASQVHAWKDCFANLQKYLQFIDENYKEFSLIFEYALPYESGRRPDVILLSKEQVIILEFKMKDSFLQEDIDQVAAYARDIREYHFESRDREVIPVLVLTHTKGKKPFELKNGVYTVSVDCILELLENVVGRSVTACDLEAWMNSKYEPLPTIVDAARRLMKHEPLPNIKQVHTSTVIPQAIKFLTEITKEARENREHVLTMVTGVPGAGKTYLGLQYVYDICSSNEHVNSVYLSGNGPLVQVLQDALGSKAFVNSIHTVVNEYMARKAGDFSKNVIVFDEGQRAWNSERMSTRHRNDFRSEPDVMVELCTEQLDWCVLLILVGEGQEINTGENSGMAQWNTAIKHSKGAWKIVCPTKLKNIFMDQDVRTSEALNLNVSLRTHTAGEVSNFINKLIAGDIQAARKVAEGINDYNMYVTRDLNQAKQYCLNVYGGRENARFGLLASSKAGNLSRYGMKPIFSRDKAYIADWFNRPTDYPSSCCALKTTISEFDCQGLEIDMPIVGWGTDMTWERNGWSKFKASEAADSEKNMYRVNSYRVLLTRGRDGFIAFVPDEYRFNDTYDVLIKAGLKVLGDM